MGCFGFICKECGTPINGNCFTGGEKCVMIHVRHGKEVGRVEGHYDEYGRVIEQEDIDEELKFRGDGTGINSHSEICNSEFNMDDSYEKLVDKRIYEDEEVDFRKYIRKKSEKDFASCDYDIKKLDYYVFIQNISIKEPSMSMMLEHHNKWYQKYIAISNEQESLMSKMLLIDSFRNIMDELTWVFWKRENIFFKRDFDKLPRVKRDGYSGIVAYHSTCYKKAMKEKTFNLIPSLQDPNQSWGKVRKKYS